MAFILSGLDGDGAAGLSEVKDARRITFVQAVVSTEDHQPFGAAYSETRSLAEIAKRLFATIGTKRSGNRNHRGVK